MSYWLDTPLMNVLEKSLDASSLRNKVLANNIANVDTPEFKRSDVDFKAVLGKAMGIEGEELPLRTTSERHLQKPELSQHVVVDHSKTSIRNDGNNVDIEREMTNVAENSIYYNAVTRALTTQFSNLRTVISQK
ncbi:MAG: flagellar basal body rod protein FlgB [Desulfitobacterium sp.]|nr:flagellar basal body rod protein FlgB [Desulfitobacterium sp.]